MFGLRPLGRAPLGTAGVAVAQKTVLAVSSNAATAAAVRSGGKTAAALNSAAAVASRVAARSIAALNASTAVLVRRAAVTKAASNAAVAAATKGTARAFAAVAANTAALVRSAAVNRMAANLALANATKSSTRYIWAANGYNAIHNPIGAGGSAGSLPTNWGLSSLATGVVTCAGAGFENGAPYVDLAYAVPSSGAAGLVFFDANNAIAAAVGQTWFERVSVKIVSGSFTGTAFIAWVLYDSTPAVIYNNAPGANFTLGSSYVSVSDSLTLATANTAYLRPSIGLASTSSTAQNFTIRVLYPIAYQSTNAPAYMSRSLFALRVAINAAQASVNRSLGKFAVAVNQAAAVARKSGQRVLASSAAAVGVVTRGIARSFAATLAPRAFIGRGLSIAIKAVAQAIAQALAIIPPPPGRGHVVFLKTNVRSQAPLPDVRNQSANPAIRTVYDEEQT